MKNMIKRILLAIMACLLCFSIAACAQTGTESGSGSSGSAPSDSSASDSSGGEDQTGETWRDNMHRENDFLEDDNRRPSREPFVDNTPEDTGEKVPYRFEAEAARIRGNSGGGEDHFCTGKSFEFSPDFSGNIALCNLGTATLSFTFKSDKAVRSTLLVRMSNQYANETGDTPLSNNANMTVNDKPVVDLSATFGEEDGETASGCAEMYFTMVTVETKISLAEGVNVLEITPVSSNYLNLDYVEIQTSATLEDQTQSTISSPASFVNVTVEPSETAGGKIAFDCHAMTKGDSGEEVDCDKDAQRARNLPALTDEIYTKTETEDGVAYTLRMFGEDVAVYSTVRYLLTLQGGATFADGSTEGKVAPGTTPELKIEEPEGQIFSHWEDADGTDLGATFVMPDHPVTIRPVFESSDGATVTLQGATLGGSATIDTYVGRTLDLSGAVFTSQPADTVLRYWYNVEDPSTYYEDATAIPVAGDITLAPAFDLATYAARDGSTSGKLASFPYYGYAEMGGGASVQPKDGYIRLLEASGVKGRDAYWGFVGTGEEREMGAVYHWTAADEELASGFYFTPLSPYKVVADKTYTMTYTVQNQGTEEITLKIYQTNSSSSPKPSKTSTKEFTLAAGATETVSITFSGFSNNNVMTTVELLTSGITDLHIGMYQYVQW